MKTWVKLYTESNRDPKIGTLTWAQRGIWSALLCLAGELDVRDEDGNETGALDTLENVAWHIRCDVAELSDAVAVFEERGMIEEQEGILLLTNYRKRQQRAPSDSREAVAARVKRHRARSSPACNEHVTSAQRGVTPPDTDAEADTDTEAEAEAEGAPAPSADELTARIFSTWEDMTGKRLTPTDRDRFCQDIEEYGLEAVDYAVQQAHEYNAPKWAYLHAILDNPNRGRDGPNAPDPPPPKASVNWTNGSVTSLEDSGNGKHNRAATEQQGGGGGPPG